MAESEEGKETQTHMDSSRLFMIQLVWSCKSKGNIDGKDKLMLTQMAHEHIDVADSLS